MKTYEAYAVHENGDRTIYEGLSRARALAPTASLPVRCGNSATAFPARSRAGVGGSKH